MSTGRIYERGHYCLAVITTAQPRGGRMIERLSICGQLSKRGQYWEKGGSKLAGPGLERDFKAVYWFYTVSAQLAG